MSRTLALCADDYALAPAIDRGILHLVGQRRLSEVSCIVNGPQWPVAGRELVAMAPVRQGRVRTGLHFNLTEGLPLSPELSEHWPRLPDLQRLIVLAHLRRLPEAALQAELKAQFTAFERARGRPPSHIDGHQHVHHLPQVREAVLALVAARADIKVRHTGRVQGPGFLVKRLLIEGTGGRVLGRRLEALGRQANTQLFGVYDFLSLDYRSLFRSWLAALPQQGGLIFCHPGEPVEAAARSDPIGPARARELAYLGSEVFAEDLKNAGVRLA